MALTVVPAYGRDYKNGKDVLADWNNNKDFKINQLFHPHDGQYINKQDAPKGATINVRFDQNRKVKVIKVA
jgi:hypothetical protein